MKTQHVSILVLNPDDKLNPYLCINHTLAIEVEEYIVFKDANYSSSSYRLGIIQITEDYSNVWLLFPSLLDFLNFTMVNILEVNALKNTLISVYENIADVEIDKSVDISTNIDTLCHNISQFFVNQNEQEPLAEEKATQE